MLIRDSLTTLRPQILAATQACGAQQVRLFGSAARGAENEGSDVDFLVTMEPGRTLLDLARLELRLEQLLGRRVDVMTEEGLPEPNRSTVLREAVVREVEVA